MSADILNSMLAGDGDGKPVVSRKPAARPIGDDGIRITLAVLEKYDTAALHGALATHHHVRARKFVMALVQMLSDACGEQSRRTELDAALDAVAEWVEKAKA